MRTMFDDDDPYDVTDALESNEGSAESKPDSLLAIAEIPLIMITEGRGLFAV
jgi:hypothetical protein